MVRGEAPRGLDRRRLRRYEDERARAGRDVAAIAVVYGGILVVLLATWSSDLDALATGPRLLLAYGRMVVVGASALVLLGAGSLRASLARSPDARGLALATPAAAGMLAASLTWVFTVGAAAGAEPEFRLRAPAGAELVESALLPALFEEWLCRGVLWVACARLTTTPRTVAATALLFGMMHLPGYGVAGVPTRLVGGVLLGLLRARTGSLAPCVAAHALHNAAAAALGF